MSGGGWKGPLTGRRRWFHANKGRELSDGCSGTGDEGAGSDITSRGAEANVVPSDEDHRHQRPPDASSGARSVAMRV